MSTTNVDLEEFRQVKATTEKLVAWLRKYSADVTSIESLSGDVHKATARIDSLEQALSSLKSALDKQTTHAADSDKLLGDMMELVSKPRRSDGVQDAFNQKLGELSQKHAVDMKAVEEHFVKLKETVNSFREADRASVLDAVFAHISETQKEIYSAQEKTLNSGIEKVRDEFLKLLSAETAKIQQNSQVALDQAMAQLQEALLKKLQDLRELIGMEQKDIGGIHEEVMKIKTDTQAARDEDHAWVTEQLNKVRASIITSMTAPTANPADLSKWLSGIGHIRYLDAFQNRGFNSYATIIALSDKELQEIGVTLPGHRKSILAAIGDLKIAGPSAFSGTLDSKEDEIRAKEREAFRLQREEERKQTLLQQQASFLKLEQQLKDEELRLEQERIRRKQQLAQHTLEEQRRQQELEEDAENRRKLEMEREAIRKRQDQDRITQERVRKEQMQQHLREILQPAVTSAKPIEESSQKVSAPSADLSAKPTAKPTDDLADLFSDLSAQKKPEKKKSQQSEEVLEAIKQRELERKEREAKELRELQEKEAQLKEAQRLAAVQREKERVALEQQKAEREKKFKEDRERERELRAKQEEEDRQEKLRKQHEALLEKEKALQVKQEKLAADQQKALEIRKAEQERKAKEYKEEQERKQKELKDAEEKRLKDAMAETEERLRKAKEEADRLQKENEWLAAERHKQKDVVPKAASDVVEPKTMGKLEDSKPRPKPKPEPEPTPDPEYLPEPEPEPEPKAEAKEEPPEDPKPIQKAKSDSISSIRSRSGSTGSGSPARDSRGPLEFGDDVDQAFKQIRDDNTPIDWMIIGYGSSKNRLQLYGAGEGGFDEFMEELNKHTEETTYSYLRFRYKEQRTKYVRVTMVPDSVPMFARAKLNTHKPAIETYFKSYNAIYAVSSPSELNLGDIQMKVFGYDLANKKQQKNAKAQLAAGKAREADTKPSPKKKIPDPEHERMKVPVAKPTGKTKEKPATDEFQLPPVDEEPVPKSPKFQASSLAMFEDTLAPPVVPSKVSPSPKPSPKPTPVQPPLSMFEDPPAPKPEPKLVQSAPRKEAAADSAIIEQKIAQYCKLLKEKGEKDTVSGEVTILFGDLREVCGDSLQVMGPVLRVMRQKKMIQFPVPLEDDSMVTLLS